jgi:hypothetical protein
MKTRYFAAVAVLLVAGGAAGAQAAESSASPVQMSNVAAPARSGRSPQTSNWLRMENPTGLPSYEMGSNGLMINGLLPANGWQG